MKIINYTPHEINIILENDTINIKSSGNARCKEIIEFDMKIHDVDIVKKTYSDVEGLPAQVEGTYIIVSYPVALSLKEKRKDLITPGELVRDNEGKIIGCKNLSKI